MWFWREAKVCMCPKTVAKKGNEHLAVKMWAWASGRTWKALFGCGHMHGQRCKHTVNRSHAEIERYAENEMRLIGRRRGGEATGGLVSGCCGRMLSSGCWAHPSRGWPCPAESSLSTAHFPTSSLLQGCRLLESRMWSFWLQWPNNRVMVATSKVTPSCFMHILESPHHKLY
jgi:hypothetical protein